MSSNIPKNSNYYYNRKPDINSTNNKQTGQTYYAKLVNVNQQQRAYVRNNNPASTRRLTDNYLNAKLAEYLNEADYEVLRNFDSVLETIPVPKVVTTPNKSPASSTYSSLSAKETDDQLNYSNEDEDFQKYYELEKFHSKLHKNMQKSSGGSTPVSVASNENVGVVKTSKSAQFNLVANSQRLDSTSVGSFSSSSASSISSQSSVANSSNSSQSSSPLLCANFLAIEPAIYSTNFKIRKPVPAPPASQPPPLSPNQNLNQIQKSHSATITKTTMSAWLHPTDSDNTLNCEYSDLTDPAQAKPQHPISLFTKNDNVCVLKKSYQSTSKLSQYDSTLLTPLKPTYSSRTTTSPVNIRSNSTANIKSASTSYLLSKITSIQKTTSPAPTVNNPLTSLAKQTSRFFQSRKSLNHTNNTNDIEQQLTASSASSSSNSISHSSSPIQSMTASPRISAASSRRAFIKKRSQSTSLAVNRQTWGYNKPMDLWILLTTSCTSDTPVAKADFISNTLRLTKRKSNQNKIAASLGLSPTCSITAASSTDLLRIRLNKIELRYLTQVELKYLKQICFNKLKSELMKTVDTGKQGRKQSFGSGSNSSGGGEANINQDYLTVIPKDESLKLAKTKNIAIRSKSVDFKFFDDLKENYFSKKSGASGNGQSQVFGQSLYKCILNDLQRVQTSSTTTTTASASAATTTGTITKRWRSNMTSGGVASGNKVLIASKFDMNVMANGVNRIQVVKQETEMFNKRNSVLFEALDLKNVKKQQQQLQHQSGMSTPVMGHKPRLSSSRNRLVPINNSPASQKSVGEVSGEVLNQNLSIRSEGLVPNIVKSCCGHICEFGLDLVGIFRIDSSKKRIKDIKEMYDSGKEVLLDGEFNPNDSACILKEYLRSLPEPLLTRDLYSSFLAASKIKEEAKKLQVICYLINLLPVPNRDTLQMLLNLLNKVRDNSSVNKMDAFNLAMVFGPNLLKKHSGQQGLSARGLSSGKLNDSDKFNLIDDIDSVISVTKYLIENHNQLFYIDSPLHNELIETINSINPLEVTSIISRKQVTSVGLTVISSNEPKTTLKPVENEYFNLYNQPDNTTPTPSSASSPNSINLSTPETSTNSKFLNYLNADFIDNSTESHTMQFQRSKNSRTKLTKIVDNFNYLNCAEPQVINFLSSPTHSPVTNKSTNKKSTVRQLKKYSNEANESKKPASSLLIQMQNQQNLRNVNNENISERFAIKKSAKSMTNLSQVSQLPVQSVINTGVNNSSSNSRRLSSSNMKNNMIQFGSKTPGCVIPKFYEKIKYNIIGEQETLV